MTNFKKELEVVEKYLAEGRLACADNTLSEIKKEYATILSLKDVIPGTQKNEEKIKEELEEFKDELKNENILEAYDLAFQLGLFIDTYSERNKKIKEKIEKRMDRVKDYLSIK